MPIDAADFEALFQAHYKALCQFAYQYVSSTDVAEDIVHDVFVSLWERRSMIEPGSASRPYLIAAVRNRALNYRRHERIESAHQIAHPPEESVRDTHADLERREATDALEQAIASLSPERKAVLILRWQQGLSYAEIADATGSSVAAVEKQLQRTLAALRKQLPGYLK